MNALLPRVTDVFRVWIEMPCSLARSRRIQLGEGDIETPLLVPSISSKAMGPIELREGRKKSKLVPASTIHTETFVRGIEEALLVSAYDIHHGFLHSPDAFRKGFNNSAYAEPNALFIDSGWYEKSIGPASGQWYHEVGEALTFEEAQFEELVGSLDPNMSAILVGWDHPGPYDNQIEQAQKFFARHDRFSSDILLKPTGEKANHDFADLSPKVAARLRAFDIIGVTEKELGETLLLRLTQLARLRMVLDDAGVPAPIHVFGGLEPLMTPLYFAAGGEIFDGLAWLRYAFRDGMSLHRESVVLLDKAYTKKFRKALPHIQLANLDAIAELSLELKIFYKRGCDWSKVRNRELLEPAFDALESTLGGADGR